MTPTKSLLAWFKRHPVSVLLTMLFAVVAIVAFIALADEVIEQDTQAFDDRVIQALRRPGHLETPIGPIWMRQVAQDITALGGATVLALLIAITAGFLALWRRYAAMGFMLVATIGGWLISSVLKAAFERPRPELVPHLTDVLTSSFPSGHSMMSAVVYLTLATLLARIVHTWKLKAYLIAVAAILTLLIGCSRVYLGVHYPTDVLAGWMAGLAWAAICWVAAHFLNQQAPEKPDL